MTPPPKRSRFQVRATSCCLSPKAKDCAAAESVEKKSLVVELAGSPKISTPVGLAWSAFLLAVSAPFAAFWLAADTTFLKQSLIVSVTLQASWATATAGTLIAHDSQSTV